MTQNINIILIDKRPKGHFKHNRAQLVQNSLWRDAQLHVRLPVGYEDPVSYFLRPVYGYNQIERSGDLSTSSSNRIETIYRPRKRRKKTNLKKNGFMYTDESLDDLILENVLKQILNSSYHRKRLQSRPHLQKPQVNHHVINKIRIPPQFPHYELNRIKNSNAILNTAPYYQNDYGFRVKSHSSKIRPGNGVDFVKSDVDHIKHHNRPFLSFYVLFCFSKFFLQKTNMLLQRKRQRASLEEVGLLWQEMTQQWPEQHQEEKHI